MDKIIYLIAIVIGLGIAYWWFGSLNEGGFSSKGESDGDNGTGLNALPNIMYSDGHTRWQLQHRSGDHVVYHDDNGNTITIRQASVERGNIHTDVGFFQSY